MSNCSIYETILLVKNNTAPMGAVLFLLFLIQVYFLMDGERRLGQPTL